MLRIYGNSMCFSLNLGNFVSTYFAIKISLILWGERELVHLLLANLQLTFVRLVHGLFMDNKKTIYFVVKFM